MKMEKYFSESIHSDEEWTGIKGLFTPITYYLFCDFQSNFIDDEYKIETPYLWWLTANKEQRVKMTTKNMWFDNVN